MSQTDKLIRAEEIQELLEKEKMFLEFFESTKTCKKAKKAFKELELQNVELARTENEHV